jgi:hypothetical protein
MLSNVSRFASCRVEYAIASMKRIVDHISFFVHHPLYSVSYTSRIYTSASSSNERRDNSHYILRGSSKFNRASTHTKPRRLSSLESWKRVFQSFRLVNRSRAIQSMSPLACHLLNCRVAVLSLSFVFWPPLRSLPSEFQTWGSRRLSRGITDQTDELEIIPWYPATVTVRLVWPH